MLAEELDVVVGVDTHKHTHTAAAVVSTGAVLEHVTVALNPKGYRALMAFGHRHGATLWAVEGTGSFGAGLTAVLVSRASGWSKLTGPSGPPGGRGSRATTSTRCDRRAKPSPGSA
jgi:transposase